MANRPHQPQEQPDAGLSAPASGSLSSGSRHPVPPDYVPPEQSYSASFGYALPVLPFTRTLGHYPASAAGSALDFAEPRIDVHDGSPPRPDVGGPYLGDPSFHPTTIVSDHYSYERLREDRAGWSSPSSIGPPFQPMPSDPFSGDETVRSSQPIHWRSLNESQPQNMAMYSVMDDSLVASESGMGSYAQSSRLSNVEAIPHELRRQSTTSSFNASALDLQPYIANVQSNYSTPPQSATQHIPSAPIQTAYDQYNPGRVETTEYLPSGRLWQDKTEDEVPALQSHISERSVQAEIADEKEEVVIRRAAANRMRNGTEARVPVKVTRRSRTLRPPLPFSEAHPHDKTSLEILVSCCRCAGSLARLILRGEVKDLNVEHKPAYTCCRCEPINNQGDIGIEMDQLRECSYENTLSAAVDRFEGLEVVEQIDDRPFPGKNRGQGLKKGKFEGDVCQRDIANGTIAHNEVHFGIEVICMLCDDRYRRCTDCGGGGGPRIGVGRWRSKELFTAGRKTCQLSHVRLATLGDMTYNVMAVEDIPTEEIEPFVSMARSLYYTTTLSVVAVPHMLESALPLCRTFDEVQKLTTDSWTLFDPMIRQRQGQDPNDKLYIGVRWCVPQTRRSSKVAASETQGSTIWEAKEERSKSILSKGKVLAGLVLTEAQFQSGTLFIPLTLPVSAGDGYEATTELLRRTTRVIQDDIATLNAFRMIQDLPQYPQLCQAWTILMLKRDSRSMSILETRRGYLPLEEYLYSYPAVSRELFPPHREIFVPIRLLKGCTILARRMTDDDDWTPHRKMSRKHRKAQSPVGWTENATDDESNDSAS